jgi:NADH:ubiquinone oxidoreductase 24 kD subunit
VNNSGKESQAMTKCCNECRAHDDRTAKLDEIITRYKDTRGSLIQVLHEAQELYGYLPFEVQVYISKKMDIPLAEIYGVVSFYTAFSIYPKGEYQIKVCIGTACYVKGAGDILDKFRMKLSIDVGECTDDGKFSLDSCRCLGSCGLAPVVMVNGKVYAKVTPDQVDDIIAEYSEQKKGACT